MRAEAHKVVLALTLHSSEVNNPDVQTDKIAEIASRLGIRSNPDGTECSKLLNQPEIWLRGAVSRVEAAGRLAIVTPFFNPAGYPRVARNFRAFLELLREVPVFPAEISFGRPWVANGLRLRGSERNVLWQKERLINLAVSCLPASFDRVAWFDGDIVLADARWYSDTDRALDQHPVVQVGDTIICDGRAHKMAVAYNFGRWTKIGYAWAARRELFPLYDAAIIGGGDMLCAYGWLGRRIRELTPSPQWFYHYQNWARRAYGKARGNIGHVAGTLVHFDHGSHAGRHYNERYRLVSGLDPEVDIAIDDAGLWAWNGNAASTERFRAALNGFFASRQDG